MTAPLVVEVAVRAPGDCVVAAVSDRVDEPVTGVNRTSTADRTTTEAFTLPADAAAAEVTPADAAATDAALADAAPDGESVTELATIDGETRYRFSQERGRDCACEGIERVAGPVSTVRARDGTLSVSFVARDREAVRDVVAALRESDDDVRVRRLVRATDPFGRASQSDSTETDSGTVPTAGVGSTPVVVDLGALTARQREVLETAHEMGFFEYPRAANTAEIADALGASTAVILLAMEQNGSGWLYSIDAPREPPADGRPGEEAPHMVR